MNRRSARKAVLQTLFQIDSRDMEPPSAEGLLDICRESLDRNEVRAAGLREFAEELAATVYSNQVRLDRAIQDSSEKWRLDRIGRVERAILRMALAEMWWMDTPSPVAIDESIELTKIYAGPQAASFVNGVLGSFVGQEHEG